MNKKCIFSLIGLVFVVNTSFASFTTYGLHSVIMSKRMDHVAKLINSGADVNEIKEGTISSDYFFRAERFNATPALVAMLKDYPGGFFRIGMDPNFDPNKAFSKKEWLLLNAVKTKFLNYVDFLLSHPKTNIELFPIDYNNGGYFVKYLIGELKDCRALIPREKKVRRRKPSEDSWIEQASDWSKHFSMRAVNQGIPYWETIRYNVVEDKKPIPDQVVPLVKKALKKHSTRNIEIMIRQESEVRANERKYGRLITFLQEELKRRGSAESR